MHSRLIPSILLSLVAIAPPAAQAAESYDNCTGFIDAVPATLTTQGTWCLRQDLSTSITSGAAITIATNNVTLDCNDFKLGGLAAGAGTQALGVSAVDRFNATVRNCNVRGFYRGIYLVGGSVTTTGGHVVEDNRVDNATRTGMRVDGDGSVVRRNFVRDTGGSSLGVGTAYAINTVGDIDVIDNTVTGVAPGADGGGNGSGSALRVENNTGGVIQGNRVRGVTSLGTGNAWGILVASGQRVSVRDNHVAGPGEGALACPDPTSGAKDNTFFGFASGITGCTNDGGNVIK